MAKGAIWTKEQIDYLVDRYDSILELNSKF